MDGNHKVNIGDGEMMVFSGDLLHAGAKYDYTHYRLVVVVSCFNVVYHCWCSFILYLSFRFHVYFDNEMFKRKHNVTYTCNKYEDGSVRYCFVKPI